MKIDPTFPRDGEPVSKAAMRDAFAAIKARLDETISVRDHGAKGDGRADDTAAIQAALDAAPANGGVVYFPAGTYRVTRTLTIPAVPNLSGGSGGITGTVKPVRLVGQHCPNLLGASGSGAQGASAIAWEGGGGACIDASGGSKHWWFGGIEDLALMDASRSGDSVGLKLGSLKGARFTRLGARHFWKNVYQAETAQADDLGGWYATWSQCVLLDARSINLELMGSSHGCSFVQCRFNGSSGIGVKLGHESGPMKRAGAPVNFHGCWIEGNGGYGLALHNAQAVSLFGGYFELNKGPADIFLSASEATANLTLIGTHHFWTSKAGASAHVVQALSKSSAKIRIKLIGCSMAPSSAQPAAVALAGGSAGNLSIIAMHNGSGKAGQKMQLYAGDLKALGGLMCVDCELAQHQHPAPYLTTKPWATL